MWLVRLFDRGATGWLVLDWLGVPTVLAVGLTGFLNVLAALPSPLGFILAVLTAAIFVLLLLLLGAFLGKLHQKWHPAKDENGKTFAKSFDDLNDSRVRFFSYYDRAYDDFSRRHDGAPTSLRNLLDTVSVKLPWQQERMDAFVQRLEASEDLATKAIVAFCQQYYPVEYGEASDPDADKLRMIHAKFWDDWYLRTLFRDTFSNGDAIKRACANWEQIKLLFFLQLAQDRQRRKIFTATKWGLNQLADRVSKIYEKNGEHLWLAVSISALKRLARKIS